MATSKGNRFLPLRGNRLAYYLYAVALAAAVAQVAFGASILSVVWCLLGAAGGLIAFSKMGPYNAGAWIAFFFVIGNTLVALYSKTVLGQALDSNLLAPEISFFVLAITSWAMLAAILLARFIKIGRPIFQPLNDPNQLRTLSWACFALGVGASVLNRLLVDVDDEAAVIGGVAIFRDLMLMAVIARTAMLLERSNNTKSTDAISIVFLGAASFFGLIDNQKTAAALPVVSYFMTVMIYRRGISGRLLLTLGIGAAAFTIIVTPFVHALRALGQQQMTIAERADFLAESISRLAQNVDKFDDIKDLSMLHFQSSYYNYYGDDGGSQMLLGRYVSVQQIDPIIALAPTRGYQGHDAIWPALPRLLPKFLNDDKNPYVEEFYTVVYYGLLDYEGGKYPTLPIAGQSFAAYGVLGVLLVPFGTFLLFFLVLKKFTWSMDRNVYGIFFMCQYAIVYAAQGSFGQYAGAALRGFPTFAAVFAVLFLITRLRWRSRKESAAVHYR